ncbi:ABC-three component system middle component 8 [Arsenicibacter rosenii]|uniref:Uncharacterized protein n=1 Tax=Arsenicibacter rosenii TaxID=1750698 RepID=A0A1S2VEJ9_9BACT|nr:hypothetical protein BLX24_23585 [Arsenicibacter rosenii]
MIKPHKYLDLESSVLNLSAEIINLLNNFGVISYDELFNKVMTKIGANARENIVNSINFLYLLGKIKYHKDIDSFELDQ